MRVTANMNSKCFRYLLNLGINTVTNLNMFISCRVRTSNNIQQNTFFTHGYINPLFIYLFIYLLIYWFSYLSEHFQHIPVCNRPCSRTQLFSSRYRTNFRQGSQIKKPLPYYKHAAFEAKGNKIRVAFNGAYTKKITKVIRDIILKVAHIKRVSPINKSNEPINIGRTMVAVYVVTT